MPTCVACPIVARCVRCGRGFTRRANAAHRGISAELVSSSNWLFRGQSARFVYVRSIDRVAMSVRCNVGRLRWTVMRGGGCSPCRAVAVRARAASRASRRSVRFGLRWWWSRRWCWSWWFVGRCNRHTTTSVITAAPHRGADRGATGAAAPAAPAHAPAHAPRTATAYACVTT